MKCNHWAHSWCHCNQLCSGHDGISWLWLTAKGGEDLHHAQDPHTADSCSPCRSVPGGVQEVVGHTAGDAGITAVASFPEATPPSTVGSGGHVAWSTSCLQASWLQEQPGLCLPWGHHFPSRWGGRESQAQETACPLVAMSCLEALGMGSSLWDHDVILREGWALQGTPSPFP